MKWKGLKPGRCYKHENKTFKLVVRVLSLDPLPMDNSTQATIDQAVRVRVLESTDKLWYPGKEQGMVINSFLPAPEYDYSSNLEEVLKDE